MIYFLAQSTPRKVRHKHIMYSVFCYHHYYRKSCSTFLFQLHKYLLLLVQHKNINIHQQTKDIKTEGKNLKDEEIFLNRVITIVSTLLRLFHDKNSIKWFTL